MKEASDPNRRIAELEAQVQRLRAEVDALSREDGQAPDPRYPDRIEAGERAELMSLGDGVAVSASLYPEPVMIETRIGTVWLSRIAGLLLMSALILGLMQTVQADSLSRGHKLAIVYGVSVFGLAFGVFARRSSNPLPKTIMGCGLAGLYYATYAACFVEPVRIIFDHRIALPLLFTLLAVIASVSIWRGSKTVAGITLFLVYYTAIAAGAQGATLSAIVYALGSGTLCALLALYFVFHFRWILFGWLSMAGLYGTFAYFFWDQPPQWTLTEGAFAAVMTIALSVNFLVLTTAVVLEARLRSSRRLMLPLLAVLNTALFYLLLWRHLDGDLAMFRPTVHALVASVLAIAAFAAETTGPARNRLFPTLITLAAITLTCAFTSYFTGALLPVALAAECLLLAIAFNVSGVVTIKVLELAVLVAAGFLSMSAYQLPGYVVIWGTGIPATWFASLATAALLTVAAWYFASAGAPRPPHARVLSGHWFLADTLFDVPASSCAMMHAGAAGLALLAAGIFEFGESPYAPFVLAAASCVLAVLGLLLGTAQIAAAAAVPMVGAHIVWHFNLWTGRMIEPLRSDLLTASGLLVLVTLLGAIAWEYYTFRERRGPVWEKLCVASVPYIVGAYTAIVLIQQEIATEWVACAIVGAGALLAAFGRFRPVRGLQSAGIFAMTYGTIAFAVPMLRGDFSSAVTGSEWAVATVLILCLFAVERALDYRGLHPYAALFIVLNATLATGALAIRLAGWDLAPIAITGLAVLLLAAGVLLPSRPYRSSALAAFTSAAALAAFAPAGWRLVTLAVLGAVILTVSGIYARFRLAQWPSNRAADTSRLRHE